MELVLHIVVVSVLSGLLGIGVFLGAIRLWESISSFLDARRAKKEEAKRAALDGELIEQWKKQERALDEVFSEAIELLKKEDFFGKISFIRFAGEARECFASYRYPNHCTFKYRGRVVHACMPIDGRITVSHTVGDDVFVEADAEKLADALKANIARIDEERGQMSCILYHIRDAIDSEWTISDPEINEREDFVELSYKHEGNDGNLELGVSVWYDKISVFLVSSIGLSSLRATFEAETKEGKDLFDVADAVLDKISQWSRFVMGE